MDIVSLDKYREQKQREQVEFARLYYQTVIQDIAYSTINPDGSFSIHIEQYQNEVKVP